MNAVATAFGNVMIVAFDSTSNQQSWSGMACTVRTAAEAAHLIHTHLRCNLPAVSLSLFSPFVYDWEIISL
jgi:hypothetical protein